MQRKTWFILLGVLTVVFVLTMAWVLALPLLSGPEQPSARSPGPETAPASEPEPVSEPPAEPVPEPSAQPESAPVVVEILPPQDTVSPQDEPSAPPEAPEPAPAPQPLEPETVGAPGPEPAPIPDLTQLPAGTVLTLAEAEAMGAAGRFVSCPIQVGDAVYTRIYGQSYVDNPDVALEELRYVKLLHWSFDHQPQVGELIIAADLAQDLAEIFTALYDGGYEIYSMYLIDDFWVGNGIDSDTASIDANNTSCFCYRPATAGAALSNHATGRAVDINPQQNPYVLYGVYDHPNAAAYIDRTTGAAHMITHDDLAFRLFTDHGFTWGGDWVEPKDYQHFEKE